MKNPHLLSQVKNPEFQEGANSTVPELKVHVSGDGVELHTDNKSTKRTNHSLNNEQDHQLKGEPEEEHVSGDGVELLKDSKSKNNTSPSLNNPQNRQLKEELEAELEKADTNHSLNEQQQQQETGTDYKAHLGIGHQTPLHTLHNHKKHLLQQEIEHNPVPSKDYSALNKSPNSHPLKQQEKAINFHKPRNGKGKTNSSHSPHNVGQLHESVDHNIVNHARKAKIHQNFQGNLFKNSHSARGTQPLG